MNFALLYTKKVTEFDTGSCYNIKSLRALTPAAYLTPTPIPTSSLIRHVPHRTPFIPLHPPSSAGIQPNQYPYFGFVSRPWGQPDAVHALTPEQYLNIFYPEGGVYSEMANFNTIEKDIKRLLKEFR